MPGRANVTSLEGRPEGQPGEQPDWSTPAAAGRLRETIEARLAALVAAPHTPPVSLNGAISHALLAPGKRVRPLLTMLAAAEFGADPMAALDAGCAVELIHTASLVLDDLPCMDDARTRRGQPATHAAFGEATAVLASIAMVTRAFAILTGIEGMPPQTRLDLVGILSRASGTEGLAAGQERDLKDRTQSDEPSKIDDINDLKTGVLFTAAVQMGGRIAGIAPDAMAALEVLGREVGHAFQTFDDMIDASRSASEAGKDTGKDSGKGTIAAVMGLDHARAEVRRHRDLALAALAPFTAPDGPLSNFISAMFAQAAAGAPLKVRRRAAPGA